MYFLHCELLASTQGEVVYGAGTPPVFLSCNVVSIIGWPNMLRETRTADVSYAHAAGVADVCAD